MECPGSLEAKNPMTNTSMPSALASLAAFCACAHV